MSIDFLSGESPQFFFVDFMFIFVRVETYFLFHSFLLFFSVDTLVSGWS